ncbi:MAG: pyruvate kinase [Oscillatoriales cyanobacterium SM2_1_8]|nr:pyruvate kinase [Oscillatoriales cyanobacterium SM2_1_8]
MVAMLFQRTKIVATLGPASRDPEILRQAIAAGLSVARLNFSHGTYAEHAATVRLLRELAQEMNTPIALLQDLQGPKVRVGMLPEPQKLIPGAPLVLMPITAWTGAPNTVPMDYPDLASEAQPGNRVLLDDGLLELRVTAIAGDETHCEVVRGGLLKSRKGVNLPDLDLRLPSMTEKDKEDLAFGLAQGVDWVSLSFVRKAEDIVQLKQMIAAHGYHTPAIAKIEKPQALACLPEIVAVADGIMVARGDLGVELNPEKVPLAQKTIVRECNRQGIPVIVATQMLESMIEQPRPTRAEASDVANAILDGADAVMLSGEFAVGKYPVQAIEMMARIAREVEAVYQPENLPPDVLDETHAIGEAIHTIADVLPLRCIVVSTRTGYSARLVSSERLPLPVYALTCEPATYFRTNLLWGIVPILMESGCERDFETFVTAAEQTLRQRGQAQPGDRLLVVGGIPMNQGANTNFLKIHRVGG